MKYRKFGRTGRMVSELGYGMWGMAGWTGSSDEESKQALQRSVDVGCNFFDTAWAYGDGRSEASLQFASFGRKNRIQLRGCFAALSMTASLGGGQ